MALEIDFILTICLISVIFLLSGILLSTLFKRATLECAYVRTGYGGEAIAENTGLFVIPVLHRVLPVNLKAMCLEIELSDESAVLTKDYMKVNLSIDFYVRVIAEKESITQAARTLGNLTLSPELLKDFLASQLSHAIRKVSADMTMNDIHQQQSLFVQKIQQALIDDLKKNGLQVDTVTFKKMDQTPKEYFREDNAFDSEGLTRLSEVIEAEKKSRHEIELKNRLEIKQKELEMENLLIEIEDKKSRNRINQDREIKKFEAASSLEIAQDAIHKKTEEKQANILSEQELEFSKQTSKIALSANYKEQLKAQMETDLIKAEAVKAEERVKSVRKLEIADRKVSIKLLIKKRKDENKTTKITEVAVARKNAAHEEAEAERIRAESEAEKLRIIEHSKLEAEKLIEKNFKYRYQNEAEGVKILIEAFNTLATSKLPPEVYPKLIDIFSGLCIGNTQILSKFGIIEIHSQNDHSNIDSSASHNKSKHGESYKIKSSKLQAILEEARHSLTEEALNTINGVEQKSSDELLLGENKA